MIPPGMFSSGVKDPYFSSVKLLLQGSGSAITDKSKNAFALSVSGNTALSTAVVKNNPKSIYFDGNGDHITADGAWPDQGTGDWTVETWLYAITPTKASYIMDFRTSGSNLVIQTGSTGQMSVTINGAQRYSSVISANTWYHLAISRIGNTHYILLNGSIVATYTSSWSWASSTKLTIATDVTTRIATTGQHFIGYLDDLRLTSGVGRYSSSFTLPTKPLPTR